MSKKRKLQLISIAFLVIAVILLVPNTIWADSTSVLGFVSLVCGTLGSIISIFIPTTYTFEFLETDWKNDEGISSFSLFIASEKHGLGSSPQVQTFLRKNRTFETVGVESNHDEKGNITIRANITFSGKAIIK